MNYTNEEIANDWNLWNQYVNASGAQTFEQWDALTVSERLELIEACFE